MSCNNPFCDVSLTCNHHVSNECNLECRGPRHHTLSSSPSCDCYGRVMSFSAESFTENEEELLFREVCDRFDKQHRLSHSSLDSGVFSRRPSMVEQQSRYGMSLESFHNMFYAEVGSLRAEIIQLKQENLELKEMLKDLKEEVKIIRKQEGGQAGYELVTEVIDRERENFKQELSNIRNEMPGHVRNDDLCRNVQDQTMLLSWSEVLESNINSLEKDLKRANRDEKFSILKSIELLQKKDVNFIRKKSRPAWKLDQPVQWCINPYSKFKEAAASNPGFVLVSAPIIHEEFILRLLAVYISEIKDLCLDVEVLSCAGKKTSKKNACVKLLRSDGVVFKKEVVTIANMACPRYYLYPAQKGSYKLIACTFKVKDSEVVRECVDREDRINIRIEALK